MDLIEDHDDHDRDFVASLARGLDVISAFTRFTPRMTLSEVAKITNISRATARRLLLTLVREGYAEKSGHIFSLAPKVLQLGYSSLPCTGMLDVAQPIMNALMQQTRESIFIAVLTGDEVTFLAGAMPDRVMAVNIETGLRLPAYAVSAGRILLAWESAEALERYLDQVVLEQHTPSTITSMNELRKVMEETRQLNHSLVDEELEVGVRGLSVPIVDSNDQVMAALNICCPVSRYTVEEMRTRFLPQLEEAAGQITQALRAIPS